MQTIIFFFTVRQHFPYISFSMKLPDWLGLYNTLTAPLQRAKTPPNEFAQSARAVEYTDCFSAKG